MHIVFNCIIEMVKRHPGQICCYNKLRKHTNTHVHCVCAGQRALLVTNKKHAMNNSKEGVNHLFLSTNRKQCSLKGMKNISRRVQRMQQSKYRENCHVRGGVAVYIL